MTNGIQIYYTIKDNKITAEKNGLIYGCDRRQKDKES